jgi:hypothetical protein
MIEPTVEERARETDQSWVDHLVDVFKTHASMFVAPLCCIVEGLQSPDDYDANKKDEYTYRVIGGNHSQNAFTRLVNGLGDDDDSYNVVRNIFLDFHTLLRYRDCVLFSDNMSNEDTIFLGNMHNADAELQKNMNFMDFVRICRRTYFVEGERDVVRECWTEKGHDRGDLEGDCSILQTWKLKCLRI